MSDKEVNGGSIFVVRSKKSNSFTSRVKGSERCTVSVLRKKLWVVKGDSRQCTFCKRYNKSNNRVPAEATLSVKRLSQAAVLTHIGLNFAGPLYLKYFDPVTGSIKAYIGLFTCASSRAVHLEVTQNLTVGTFLRAFKRFVSKRGTPVTKYFEGFLEERAKMSMPLCLSFAEVFPILDLTGNSTWNKHLGGEFSGN